MSLAIDLDEVREVLLQDGWHKVALLFGRSTFSIDAYEFIWKERLVPTHDDVSSAGFQFMDEQTTRWTYGPVSSILAVSTMSDAEVDEVEASERQALSR